MKKKKHIIVSDTDIYLCTSKVLSYLFSLIPYVKTVVDYRGSCENARRNNLRMTGDIQVTK